MKSWLLRFIFVIFLVLSPLPTILSAQGRTGHLTLIILVDKSLSMRPYFQQVKSFLLNKVLGEWLKTGDSVALFTFYGTAHLKLWDSPLDANEKPQLRQTISEIQADGRFTDIGSALDTYEKWAKTAILPPWRRFVLLLTDERQEAPPNSPYQFPNFAIQHPLLKGARIISHGQWKAITVDTVNSSTLDKLMDKLSPLFSPQS